MSTSEGYSLKISGDTIEEAEAKIGRLIAFLDDLRPFWPLVVPLATSWFRRQFETEGAFGGSPWAPLSPGYDLFKSSVAPGQPLLVLTGAMKQAASNPSRHVTPNSLTLTINDPKVGYHQEGTDKMPARPLVFGAPLPPEAAAELDVVANRYVSELIQRIF